MGTLEDLLLRQAEEIAQDGHPGWGNTMTEAAQEIARLREELARAAAREVQLTSELERWLVQEASNGEVGCDYCMAFVADESVEIQHELDCPLADSSPLAEAAQELLNSSARELEAEGALDQAETQQEVSSAIDELDGALDRRRAAQVRYSELLAGREED